MPKQAPAVVLVVFTLTLVTLFSPVLLRGETIALGDVPDQFLPWRIFAAEEISEGRIPLWNPYTFCGAPFLANMQSAVLYPVDRLLDAVFGPVRAIGVGMMIHLFLGGAFLYLLARSFGASEIPAGVVAVGYALGGFHAIHFLGGNLLTITSSIYLPGHLWIVHEMAKRIQSGRKTGLLPMLAIVLAVQQVLSGHAQMTFYNAVFVGIFVASIVTRMESGRGRFLLLLSAIGLVSALISAPQLLPTFEYSEHSSRTGLLPYPQATEFSFGWEFLPSFFLPEYLGTRADLYTQLGADTYWGDWKNWSGVYLGLLPAMGFVLFFFFQIEGVDRKRALLLLGPLLLVGLILALGRNTPIYSWVHHNLPLFGKFRAPSKFLPGFIIPFAVISALGLEGSLRRLSRVRMCHKRALAWGGTALLAGVILLGWALRADFLNPPIQRSEVIQREVFRFLAMTLIAAGALLFYIRSEREKRRPFEVLLAQILLLSFIALDVGLYFKKHLVFSPYAGTRIFPTEWVDSEIGARGRLLTSPEVPRINDCVSGRILSAGGYDPFQVGMYVDYFRDQGVFAEGEIPDAWSPNLGAAAELGVTHVLTTQPLEGPNIEPHRRNGPWALYRVIEPRPLVEFVPEQEPGADETAESVSAPVALGWDGGRLLVSGSAPSRGTLLIRNVFMPGWSALDRDGRATEVEAGVPFWQRLPIEVGDFDLKLVYRPDSWKNGVRFCGLGLALFVFWGLGIAWKGGLKSPS